MGVCAACHLDNATPEHFHTRRHLGRKATADREYQRGRVMGLRRYAPIAKSRGTEWPPEVRREIERLDNHRCVCERAGFPPEVIARCGGDLQADHVRASHGIGMKSPSTVANGTLLSAYCHRWKTEHGKEARPLLLDWIARRSGDCGHVEPLFGCPGPCNRADPMQMAETA